MGLFEDEHGELIVWRVVPAAVAAIALVAAIAIALIPPGGGPTKEADGGVELPAVGVATRPEEPEDPESPPEDGRADDEPVPLADVSALSELMDEDVASEVSRQLAASGIEGADGAWTTRDSVATQGLVTGFTVWFPREGVDPQAWDASYDESFGMLELAPAGDAS